MYNPHSREEGKVFKIASSDSEILEPIEKLHSPENPIKRRLLWVVHFILLMCILFVLLFYLPSIDARLQIQDESKQLRASHEIDNSGTLSDSTAAELRRYNEQLKEHHKTLVKSLSKADRRMEEESNRTKKILNEKEALAKELLEVKTANVQNLARLEGAKQLESVLEAQLKELSGSISVANKTELESSKEQNERLKKQNHKQESELKTDPRYVQQRKSLVNSIRSEMKSSRNQELELKSREMIRDALQNESIVANSSVFEDIIISLELPSSLMKKPVKYKKSGRTRWQEDERAIVGLETLQKLEGHCVIYGAGINYENGYELKMAKKTGCEVHAFDCTMTDEKKLYSYRQKQANYSNLEFHPWCIGNTVPESMTRTKRYDMQLDTRMYHTLDQIMSFLGHDYLDILKFDIEGFEWPLFDSILTLSSDQLPRQLAFELHTEGAREVFVPPATVRNKGRKEVVELFKKLQDAGYRVVSKNVNKNDPYCCEFVVYRISE